METLDRILKMPEGIQRQFLLVSYGMESLLFPRMLESVIIFRSKYLNLPLDTAEALQSVCKSLPIVAINPREASKAARDILYATPDCLSLRMDGLWTVEDFTIRIADYLGALMYLYLDPMEWPDSFYPTASVLGRVLVHNEVSKSLIVEFKEATEANYKILFNPKH